MKKQLLLVLLLSLSGFISAQEILSVKEQSRVTDEILADRLNNLLPQLMEREKIDMWVIISREYNEDPVIKTFLPATWLAARRRTILVFFRDTIKDSFEKLAIARYNVGDQIKAAWDMEKYPVTGWLLRMPAG